MRLIAIAALLSARTVYADCTYQNGYYDPGLDGACVADTSVPAGCPVHFITPPQPPATFTVHRGSQDITLPATASIVETVGVPVSLVDPLDCDCTRTQTTMSFDRQALALTGAQAGDTVSFAPGHLYAPQVVKITAAGPCPEVVWPTRIVVATQCDLCPRQASSSCASTDSSGAWLLGTIALGWMAHRRRSRKAPEHVVAR
jgi:MYXO-CTERM domain-containing protein